MGPRAGSEPSSGAWLAPGAAVGYPFCGPGLAARVMPLAAVAVLAEASLALPPGPQSQPAVIASIVLPLTTAAEFLLAWGRLPGWLSAGAIATREESALSGLRAAAARAGARIDIEPVPGGTRLAWRFPAGAAVAGGART
jgi:hypothetical protein